jgi:hypothetical protein
MLKASPLGKVLLTSEAKPIRAEELPQAAC